MDERGSMSVEAAVLLPVVVLLVAVLVYGGRYSLARQAVQAAASDAARTASLARTASQATSTANRALPGQLASNGLACQSAAVRVDTRGFAVPAGTPATVTATVSCTIATHDLPVVGQVPVTVTATATSPLDTYRERR